MSWDRALDAQTDLVHAYRTKQGMDYLIGFLVDFGEKRGLDDEAMMAFGRTVVSALDKADPIWVSEDIVELVEAASETFKPEPVFLDDLIVPAGFALLERPISTWDRKGLETKWRAVSWTTAKAYDPGFPAASQREAVLVCLYSHADDDDGYTTQKHRLVIGGSTLTLLHFFPLVFGEDVPPVDGGSREILARVQVLWRLAKQEIVIASQERASRPTWRRASTWRQIKHVTVLRLRRIRSKRYEGDEREVEWTHRWLVRGHWRDQWYPLLKAHRQIWISGYVKGPDDKPFVAKDRAIDFTR